MIAWSVNRRATPHDTAGKTTMGCCESVYVEYSHEYVTEEGSDGGIPRTPDAVFAGVESASCSSSDTCAL